MGAEFLALRERGHQVLQGRKDRRRFSLLGSRRFMGDYLGVAATNGPGSRVRSAINLPANETVLFSCRGELLETKFGRSSKPSPRILVVTRSKFYIVSQQLVQKQVQISVERTIPLGAIKFISISTSRDDWFSLGIGSPQEPDPLMTCILKTELFTHLQIAMPGSFNLKISDSLEYAKKPGKMQVIKVIKDSTMREDFYKSATIHTGNGEPPNSVSRPMPKGKAVPAKPFTKGRLIRPGGPDGRPSKLSNTRNTKPINQSHAPAASQSQPVPRPVPQPAATVIPSHTRNVSSISSTRSVPPPPPPAPPAPPAAPKEPQYRVLYDFAGQSASELTIKKDDLITVIQKENNGKSTLYGLSFKTKTDMFNRMVARQDLYRPRLGSFSISQRRSTAATTSSSRYSTHTPPSSPSGLQAQRCEWRGHSK